MCHDEPRMKGAGSPGKHRADPAGPEGEKKMEAQTFRNTEDNVPKIYKAVFGNKAGAKYFREQTREAETTGCKLVAIVTFIMEPDHGSQGR